MSVFDRLNDTLFRDGNFGQDALFRPAGQGEGVPVRVILIETDAIQSEAGLRFAVEGQMLELQSGPIAQPMAGDTIEIADGRIFQVQGTPQHTAGVWRLDTFQP